MPKALILPVLNPHTLLPSLLSNTFVIDLSAAILWFCSIFISFIDLLIIGGPLAPRNLPLFSSEGEMKMAWNNNYGNGKQVS
jgi:hypothetical protein